MTIRAYTCAERPDLWERTEHEVTDVWPEYNTHGDVLHDYWWRLDEAFAEYQFAIYDEEADAVLAEGHSIPCAWDGTPEGIPDGIDGLVVDAFRLRDEGGTATTLSALAIEIAPPHQGGGLSRTMIGAMRALAADHGLPDLIAPLRPTRKERYPLTPIERYASWRPRGRAPVRPLDPPARSPRRGDRPPRTAVTPDHGHRGRLGGVDRVGVPGERRRTSSRTASPRSTSTASGTAASTGSRTCGSTTASAESGRPPV